jgi:hypothetical protein
VLCVADKIAGYLEVGFNDRGEVIVNHPDLTPDENGVGHIVFSPNQARGLARTLLEQADEAERAARVLHLREPGNPQTTETAEKSAKTKRADVQ